MKASVILYIKGTSDEVILKDNSSAKLREFYTVLYTCTSPKSQRKTDLVKSLRYMARMLSQGESYNNIIV